MPMVPTPPAIIVRMVVTVAIGRPVPAMAPSVADVSRLFDVGRLRGLTWNGVRHRGRRRGSRCNAAKCGETDKCRNKFHDAHLLTLCWRRPPRNRFGALLRFSTDERLLGFLATSSRAILPLERARHASAPACFPICNRPISNGAVVATHHSQ